MRCSKSGFLPITVLLRQLQRRPDDPGCCGGAHNEKAAQGGTRRGGKFRASDIWLTQIN